MRIKTLSEIIEENSDAGMGYDEITYFQFLDDLRESGVTNMFESPTYLMDEYGLSKDEAFQIFLRWTKQDKFKKDGGQ